MVEETNMNVLFTNVFSPNNDGINDLFYLTSIDLKDWKGGIFNRWGELIKAISPEDPYWDGTLEDQSCNSGTYFFQIELKELDFQFSGFVQLVR